MAGRYAYIVGPVWVYG